MIIVHTDGRLKGVNAEDMDNACQEYQFNLCWRRYI